MSKLISWKHSFEKISKDLELAKKKKQTLDNLFNTGRISQATHDSLDTELSKAIAETEARQKELAGQMSSKIAELEEQVSTLEMLLASSEIQYVAGEIDDELHTHESKAFGLGLEATKQELNAIRNIIADIMQDPIQPQLKLETHEVMEAEVPKTEEVAENLPETIVETPSEEKAIEVTTETQPETTTQMPTEAPAETTETVAEIRIENPAEASAEAPTTTETTIATPEAPVEIPKEESIPSEEVTIEVVKEVKEEQVISFEPITEKNVEEMPAEVAGAYPEEATFFRDPKEASEEKKREEKEESKG
jgi:hypothetical protein